MTEKEFPRQVSDAQSNSLGPLGMSWQVTLLIVPEENTV